MQPINPYELLEQLGYSQPPESDGIPPVKQALDDYFYVLATLNETAMNLGTDKEQLAVQIVHLAYQRPVEGQSIASQLAPLLAVAYEAFEQLTAKESNGEG